jgi:hypothetical protein
MYLRRPARLRGRRLVLSGEGCVDADAERANREAIQRKCEKLEEIVEVAIPPVAVVDNRSSVWKTPI